eukprot:6469224-Amphidinium_carterae.1
MNIVADAILDVLAIADAWSTASCGYSTPALGPLPYCEAWKESIGPSLLRHNLAKSFASSVRRAIGRNEEHRCDEPFFFHTGVMHAPA